jgi:NADPH:quinone reductase-like Zn-dependent oxidoreductase
VVGVDVSNTDFGAPNHFSCRLSPPRRQNLPRNLRLRPAPQPAAPRTQGYHAPQTEPHPIDFVVESDRAQLSEIVGRVRDGRLRTHIGNVSTLDDAVAAFNPTKRIKGKTIIRVRP